MTARLLSLCFAWLYFVTGLAHAGEPPPPTKPRYADVAVDAKSLGSAGPVVRRRVRERADVVLRRGAVLPPRDGDDPVISVAIDELTGDEPGYVFRIEILRSGKPTGKVEPVECRLCTEGELVDAIEGRLEHVVADLPAPEKDDGPPPPRVDPTPVTPPGDQTDQAPKRGMKIAGGTILGIGLATTVTGAVLSALEPRPKDNDPLNEINTRPPGYALLGVGLGFVVTGAVLLIVDARKRARHRNAVAARKR